MHPPEKRAWAFLVRSFPALAWSVRRRSFGYREVVLGGCLEPIRWRQMEGQALAWF